MGVISRCIPPINPTDPERFHMYVHNNIFFSFPVDSELEQLYPKKTSEEKVEATVTSHDSYETENGQSLGASGVSNSNASSVLDKNNANANESSAPDMPLENQLTETEQATYASSNNDLKDTKAFQEADVPGLYNFAMTIIDYRGYRVVAQSVLPGILQGDKIDSILYGSVDNGKKVCWSEDFHSKGFGDARFDGQDTVNPDCLGLALQMPLREMLSLASFHSFAIVIGLAFIMINIVT